MNRRQIFTLSFLCLLLVPTWAIAQDTPAEVAASLKKLFEQATQVAKDIENAAKRVEDAVAAADEAAGRAEAAAELAAESAKLVAAKPRSNPDETGTETENQTQSFEETIRTELAKFSGKPNFAEACSNAANSFEVLINKPSIDATKVFELAMLDVPNEITMDDWEDDYATILKIVNDEATGADWKTAYQTLIRVLKNPKSKADTSKTDTSKADTSKTDTSKADTSKADTPAPAATDDEKFIENISKQINSPTAAYSADPEFKDTLEKIIAKLEAARKELRPQNLAAISYFKKIGEAVTEGIDESQGGNQIRPYWRTYFDELLKVEVKKRGEENPEEAVILLVAGLKKAISDDFDWQKEMKAANPALQPGNRVAAAAITAAGSGVGGSTWHSVIMARKTQRIIDRSKLARARIARIRGQ